MITISNTAKDAYDYYHSMEAMADADVHLKGYEKDVESYKEYLKEHGEVYYGEYGLNDSFEGRQANLILDRAEWTLEDFVKDICEEHGNVVKWFFMYLLIFSLGILFPLYMYPTKVARRNAHAQTTAIAWLNFLLGLTIVVWIVMLIWANSSSEKKISAEVLTIRQTNTSITDKLKELQSLRETGILTEEEFAAKKAELLAKL